MTTTTDYKELWSKCLDRIGSIVSPEHFAAWFRPIVPVAFDVRIKEDGQEHRDLTLGVPSGVFVEFLDSNFGRLLITTVRSIFGPATELYYQYNVVADAPDTSVKEQGATASPAIKPVSIADPSQGVPVAEFNSQLNPLYTFENYCGSECNKIARTIARAIAEDPKCQTFNPLFVFGPTGVGKTHLIQAIGIKILERNPLARVLYVSARLFESQFTDATRRGKINEFIRFYQSIDTLIIDDIQDLMDKEKTQNTFFHIFNHLHQNQKQIIMSSDCCPSQLKGMPERLLSRFKWGMTVELFKPDLELRKSVLHMKARHEGLEIPENVLEFIAESVTDSVRELEGIIVSLYAHATLLKKEINMDLARCVMANVVKIARKAVNFEMVIQNVSAHYGVEPETIFSKSRKREISDARQMVMYMAKRYAHMPVTAIGTQLSRSHSTVLHGCQNIEERLAYDKQLQTDAQAIAGTFSL